MRSAFFLKKISCLVWRELSRLRWQFFFLPPFFLLGTLFVSLFGRAEENYGITYQGRIMKTENQPLVAESVDFYVRLIAPRDNCILYSEIVRTSMTSGDGTFSVVLGKSKSVDSGDIPFPQLFSVNLDFPPARSCSLSYKKRAGDTLKLFVAFNDGSGYQTLAPLEITPTPFSLDTLNVAGVSSENVLRLQDGPARALTLVEFTELEDLIAGTSNKYANRNGTNISLTEDAIPRLTKTDKVSGNAIVTGTIGGNTSLNTSGNITTSGDISTTGNLMATSASIESTRVTSLAFNDGTKPDPVTVTLMAPTAVTIPYVLRLPPADGLNGQVLQTNGAGQLTWQTFNTNVTDGSMSNSKLADMPAGTLKANITGAAAAPSDVTIASLQGTTASTFAAGNDTRLVNAVQKTGDSMNGMLTLAAGTSTLSPLRIPAGALVTTAVSGNLESNGTNLFWTNNSAARQKIAMYPEASTPANGQLLIGNGTGFNVANLTAGSGVTITNSAGGISIAATGTGGTVTSVTSTNADIAIANTTTAPALTLNAGTTGGATDANKIAKLDANGQLTPAMVPNHDISKLTTGVLPIARGGTNSSTALAGNRVMVSSATAIVEAAAISSSRALVSDTNGLPTHSTVTSTELGYLSGVTSSIQTQLTGKASSTGYTNYSVMGVNSAGALTAYPGTTANTMLQYSLTGPVWSSATYPSSTTANQLLYSSANNTIAGLASTNSSVLTTNASGVPSWAPLSNDSFSQYALLAGRASGQTLNGAINASGSLTLDSTAHSTKGNVLINPTAGNVGIGTTSPGFPLHVNGSVNLVASVSGSNGQGTFLTIQNSSQSTANWNLATAGVTSWAGVPTGSFVLDQWGIGPKMVVIPGGNVGVGTTNPSEKLHVLGNIRLTGTTSHTLGSYSILNLSADDDGSGSEPMNFLVGTTERMRISPSGNVGIGTTSPQAKLDVAGVVAVNGNPTIQWQEFATPLIHEFSLSNSTAGNQLVLGVPANSRYLLVDVFVTSSVPDHFNLLIGRGSANATTWVNTPGTRPSTVFGAMARHTIKLNYTGDSDNYSSNYGTWYSSQTLPLNSNTSFDFAATGHNGVATVWVYMVVRAYSL